MIKKRKASERSPPPVSASQASKPTSSQTSNQPNVIEIDNEAGYVDVDDSDSKNCPKSQSSKQSWAWLHFKEEVRSDGEEMAVCQVVKKGGKICGVQLKRDKTKSTKTFMDTS
jgi:hypothetical protein